MSPARQPLLTAALLAALVAGGCATARFGRSVLPPGVGGPPPEIRSDHALVIDAERVRLTGDYLAIHNPPLRARMSAADRPESITFVPRLVVVHYTAVPTLEGTLEAFAGLHIGPDRDIIRRNGLLNVGIQFVVDQDGAIYALYPETVIARHVIGLNHVAIGIENVGDADLPARWLPGRRRAEAPLTRAQLAANLALVRYLAARYPSIDWVIGHSEYRWLERPTHPAHHLFYEELATYRTEKSDPGRRFLKRLRRALRRAAEDGVG